MNQYCSDSHAGEASQNEDVREGLTSERPRGLHREAMYPELELARLENERDRDRLEHIRLLEAQRQQAELSTSRLATAGTVVAAVGGVASAALSVYQEVQRGRQIVRLATVASSQEQSRHQWGTLGTVAAVAGSWLLGHR